MHSGSRKVWFARLLRHFAILLLTALLGGLLGATLVRFAPGFGVDEQELDTRLSGESIRALRQSHAGEHNILRYYAAYLAGMFRGDLGVSQSLGQPVTALFAERIPVTLRSLVLGLACGWFFGLALALPGILSRRGSYEAFTAVVTGIFLCLPSAVLALLFLYLSGPVPLAIGLVVFPRVLRYSRNLLLQTYNLPHVITARAKGLSGARILFWHILPPAAPQLLALVGVSVSMAFGAAIPIEVICDSPGIGQLAWQAALGRDLPLLVNLTLLVALMTLVANSLSDLTARTFLKQEA